MPPPDIIELIREAEAQRVGRRDPVVTTAFGERPVDDDHISAVGFSPREKVRDIGQVGCRQSSGNVPHAGGAAIVEEDANGVVAIRLHTGQCLLRIGCTVKTHVEQGVRQLRRGSVRRKPGLLGEPDEIIAAGNEGGSRVAQVELTDAVDRADADFVLCRSLREADRGERCKQKIQVAGFGQSS